MRLLVFLGVFAPSVLAACATTGQYNAIGGFAGSNGCVPSGYFQAQDLGNTNPTDLVSRCEAQCTTFANCDAYVGELWKAADSNLYTGQCFYYSAPPSGPQQCADHPTILIAEKKDHALACFSSSASAATAFCSSYLQIGTVTTYTSTTTPSTTVKTTTSTTTTRLTSSTTTTTPISTDTTSTTTTTTQIASTSSTVTSTLQTTISETTTVTEGTVIEYVAPGKRTVAPSPACLQTDLSASRISSACSCLSIASTTVSLVSTRPTSTKTKTSTSHLTSLSTVLTTSTTTSTTSTTGTVTSVILTTFTSLVTTTKTSASTKVSTSVVASPTFTFVAKNTNGCYPLDIQGQFYSIPVSTFEQALQYCSDRCTSLDNSGFYPNIQVCKQIYVAYRTADRGGPYDCNWGGSVNGPGEGEWYAGDFQCGLPAPYGKYGEWYQVQT